MPMDRRKYPANWEAFSREIRFGRAGGRCECTGQCGLHKTHGIIEGPGLGRRCKERHGEPARWAKGKVILTTAHLCDCNPPCAIAEHVIAACNRCHLRIDQKLHALHASLTRDKKRGQLRLFGESA